MESASQVIAVVTQVAMGFSLAACAGLRAFLPLAVVGLAARLGWIPLTAHLEWLASTPALLVFGVAVAAEMVGDKVPWFDHVLDVAQSFVKPVAGVVVVAAVLHELGPLQRAVLALVLGAGAAGAVHLGKSGLRVASSALTGGLANPLVSVAEEGGAWALALAAVWVPLAAVFALSFLVGLALWGARRRRVRSRTLRPA